MIKSPMDYPLKKYQECAPDVSIYESDCEIERFSEAIEFSNLDYLTISQITKRRHRYTRRIPMFYFESIFNMPEESENEVSENLSFRSYAHLNDCGFRDNFLSYLKMLTSISESLAKNIIKKSYRSPYLAIANGAEISPHVHLYNDRIDAMPHLSTVSICFNLQSVDVRFLIYEKVAYENSKLFKDKYHNIPTPIKDLSSTLKINYRIRKDLTVFVMNSTQTLHAVSEFKNGACLFFIYDKVELI